MPINSLNTILGLRNNVSITVMEHYAGLDVVVGAAYYTSGKLIPLDGLNLTMSTDVAEFHWRANDLEVYLTKELQELLNKEIV